LDTKHSDPQDACCNDNNNSSSGEHAVANNNRNEVELRLRPLPSSYTLDPSALHDQGYGSERSPEDEHPPSLPGLLELTSKYPFITRGKWNTGKPLRMPQLQYSCTPPNHAWRWTH
jgi:hypothetical protein